MRTTNRSVIAVVSLFVGTVSCSSDDNSGATKPATDATCMVSEPQWLTRPADAAIPDDPAPGYYYVNQDRSIWASALWPVEEIHLWSGEDGNKVGWFRPAGVLLEITGHRLDGEAPTMEASVPCCYPTRFQATGLIFPTEGCWNVTARADDKELSFVVAVGLEEDR